MPRNRFFTLIALALIPLSSWGTPALERPAPELSPQQQLDWAVGRSFAHRPWVSSPATTTARDGLGPQFNARSCAGCHPGNSQGQLPTKGLGTVLRLPKDSLFGSQLQDRALPGFTAEGRIAWRVSRHAPRPHRQYLIAEYRQLSASARLAPMLIGLGKLDAVDRAQILAWEDVDDRDNDGVSGRAAALDNGQLGRFGWKASQASLREQIAQAFAEDMGIDSAIRRATRCDQISAAASENHRMAARARCERASGADQPDGSEISPKILGAVEHYIANLAIPGSRADHHGPAARTFAEIGCASCHRPAFATASGTIYPYSDLLLHDMGDGLNDGVAEGAARPEEWRTAPLWGLGIRSAEADNTRLLHDGRANSIREAIAWHGGEARAARQRFNALSQAQQARLLEFLKEL